jgi:hypothetical protein
MDGMDDMDEVSQISYLRFQKKRRWIPAFAGMTDVGGNGGVGIEIAFPINRDWQ